MGLDIYLHERGQEFDWDNPLNSDKYPEHLFKKNYLRSSYNNAGFDNVTRNLIGQDFYSVFDTKDEAVETTKRALGKCLERAQKLLIDLKNAPQIEALSVAPMNMFSSKPNDTDEAEAIRIYLKAIGEKQPFGSFSNEEGYFFLEKPMTVHAIISGKTCLGQPANILICKTELDWYIEGAEILIEFIEYALTMKNPEIDWSC